MVTILTRGFMRRSLPALLALVLGLLVAWPPAASHAPARPGLASAAVSHATTRATSASAVHSGHSTPAAEPPAESARPDSDDREQIPTGTPALRAQLAADTHGSRAPPTSIA